MDNTKMMVLFFNTFQKEYRNRMMIFFVILTILLIFGINSILNFAGLVPGIAEGGSLGNKKLFAFFYIINIWNVLLSVIIGINCVKSDLKSGVVSQILSLPIKRSEYIFARILGATGLVLSYYFLAFILGVIIFTLSSQEGVVFDFKIIFGLLPTSILILSTVTLSVLFSLYFSKIQSLFACLLCVAFLGHYNSYFSTFSFSYSLKELGVLKIIGLLFHFLLPRVGIFSEISNDVILGNPINFNLWIEIPHWIISYSLLAFLTHLALKRKDL